MSFEIDPAFRSSGTTARKRQQARRIKRVALGGTAVVALFAVVGWIVLPRSGPPLPDAPDAPLPTLAATGDLDDTATLTPVAGSAEVGIVVNTAPFIDLRRDPMILRVPGGDGTAATTLPGPTALDAARVGPPVSDRLSLIREPLVIPEARLALTLPSSREDLAFFQAQRTQGIVALLEDEGTPAAFTEAEMGPGALVEVDGEDGSWGELIETSGESGDIAADQAIYVETRIENTTTPLLALREAERGPLYSDTVVVTQTERELTEVLVSSGIDEVQAGLVVAAAARLLDASAVLPPGSVAALRWRMDLGQRKLMQLSLYGADGRIGTLAQVGAGRFERASDPWFEEDLLQRTDSLRDQASQTADVRLLDALYSAAIRNGLSTGTVGELLVMMSKTHDLDRIADPEDALTLLYAPEAPGTHGASLLYAAIRGPSGEQICYIVPLPEDDGFGCHDDQAQLGGGGGLLVPVNGTKSSGFGPRMHPILRQLRNHNGVDWAAPTGTPVIAAAAGTVERAGNGGGYGNVIYLDHGNGLQTRYAHLNAFASGLRAGQSVAAGELIGFVGTTGRSTGPHLHFEVWVGGTPTNPETFVGVPVVSTPGSGAVEALVNQIIRVESAGRADARNPLSTATGLGQFIESTWIRMMQTYRPDLVATKSRQELLNLRTNPELSREMVRNLARENEAFLRARGHQITPGRLYLAHFLGPGGANTALRASPAASVLEIMGAGVVNANPFLRGKTIADLRAWADRKMAPAANGSAAPIEVAAAPVATSPEVREFIEMIDGILEQAG